MIVMEHKLQKMILRDQYLVNKKIAWYLIVSVLLFLSAFSSCSLGEKQNAPSKNEIYIADLDSAIQKDWYLYSDVFKSVRVIPLAMDKSVLLGDVNKMQVYKGHYIVLDEEIARGVYLFDSKGRFIRKIGDVGSGPGEYSKPTDFTIDTKKGEIYIFDYNQKKIFKYDIASGKYLGVCNVEHRLNRMFFSKGYLYANIDYQLEDEPGQEHYLLQRIDFDNEGNVEMFFKVADYKKGWDGIALQGNMFFNLGTESALFVQDFMDTIIYVNGDQVIPYMVVKSQDWVCKTDLEILGTTDNPSAKGLAMMKLIQHLGAQRRAYNLSDVFVNDSVIGFSYMQGMMGTDALYDKSTGETMVFDRSKDDMLFGEQPSHRQIPTFLYASDRGVFYSLKPSHLPEMKYFISQGLVKDEVIGKNDLDSLDGDANPVLLYYEYKD